MAARAPQRLTPFFTEVSVPSALHCSNTQVTDVSWAVLAQLPLRSLNLSGSRFVATRPLEAAMLASLTSLQLLRCGLDDRSCRHLAAALPQLLHLQLGASGVGDKGLRALCSLPKVHVCAGEGLCGGKGLVGLAD